MGNNVIGDATGSSGFGASGDQTGTSGEPLSPAAIAKVSPAVGTPAGGTTVTITGLNLFGATAVYFGTTPAEYFEVYVNNGVNAGAEVIAVPPPGTGTVDIVVDTAAGDSVISQLDQFTYVAAPTISGVSPASGPVAGGTTVTITGTGFTGATAVDFGTNRATNFAINPAGTQITATSPAATGTVNITVATAGGTSALVIADHFTYIAAAPVVVTPSNWTPAGLTLALDGGGNLHVYQSGTTTDAVAPSPLAYVTDIAVTSPGSNSADLTIDSTNGDPIPTGGLNYSGPGGLVIIGSSVVALSGTNTYMGEHNG